MRKSYFINLDTPFGNKSGKLIIDINNNSLSGQIIAGNIQSTFNNGHYEKGNFTFSSILKSMFFSIQFTAQGTIKSNKISGTVKTNYGIFKFSGVEL